MQSWVKYLTLAAAAVILFATPELAWAQDAAPDYKYGIGLGAGAAMGFAVLGAGIGQGKAAAAALEGSARNPQMAGKLQTMMIIGLVFIETLVLFTLAFPFVIKGALAG